MYSINLFSSHTLEKKLNISRHSLRQPQTQDTVSIQQDAIVVGCLLYLSPESKAHRGSSLTKLLFKY